MASRATRAPLGPNPYVVGPPVYGDGPFFGRAESVKAIVAPAKKGGLLVRLSGPPRVGKTSLLKHIEATRHTGVLPVYVDIDDHQVDGPLGALRSLAAEIGALVGVGPVELGDDVIEPATWGAAVYSALQPKIKRRRLLLLVDGSGGADPEIVEGLVALSTAGVRASGVFASTQGVDLAAQHPCLAKTEIVDLPVLSVQEARALITEPLAQSVAWEEDAILHLLDQSGRHPALLQALCYETFEVLRARPVDSVGMMEVVGAARKLESVESSLSWLWQPLAPGQRVILAAMAEAAPIDRSVFLEELREVMVGFHVDPGDEIFSEVIRSLIDAGYLKRETTTRVAFSLEALRRWIGLHHPLETMREARLEGSTARAVAQRHLTAARDAHLLGRFNEAVEAYRRALDVDEDYEEARLGLGRALVEFGHLPEAIEVLRDAMERGIDEAEDELAEAYLRWIAELKAAKQPYEAILNDAITVAPEHEGVTRARRRHAIDQVRRKLELGRTREAQRGLETIYDSGEAEGLAALKKPALEHLARAIESGAARKGRQVADFVAAMGRCWPNEPEPRLQYAAYLVEEGERLEGASPPSALSHYRRASETLDGLPEGCPSPPSLSKRIEAGQRRIASIFLHEQEASLEQLMASGQYEAARSLAHELAVEHSSAAAREVLARLDEREAAAAAYEAVLDLIVRGDREAAREAAVALDAQHPAFVGPDGRTAAELLKTLPPVDPTPAPKVVNGAIPRRVPPAAAPSAGRAPQPGGPPEPTQEEPPGSVAPLGPLPVPPPPRPRSNAPLWAAIVVLATVIVGRELYNMNQPALPGPATRAVSSRAQPPAAPPVVSRAPAPVVVEQAQPTRRPPPVAVAPEPAKPTPTPRPQVAPEPKVEVVAAKPVAEAAAKPDNPVSATPAPQAVAKAAAPLPLDVEGPRPVTADERARAEALVLEGRKQVQLGAYRSAAESYRMSLELNPDQPTVLQDLGLVYYVLKRFNDAEAVLLRSITLQPSAMTRFDLAKVYRAQERNDAARSAFDAALSDSTLPPSMVKEAREYLARIDEEEALQLKNTPPPQPKEAPRKTKVDVWGEGDSGDEVRLFEEESQD